MVFLAVLLFLWGIGVLVYNIFKPSAKNESSNHYIREHNRKMKDDELYKKYMDWCFKNGEAPMEKKGFESIRDKEKYINSFMKKY